MQNLLKKIIGDKSRYNRYKKDINALPQPYAEAMEAIQKYMWNFAKGDGFMDALEAVLQIFQENSAENVPISSIIGADPVQFCDEIMRQYPDDLWLITYQNKLRKQIKAIDQP